MNLKTLVMIPATKKTALILLLACSCTFISTAQDYRFAQPLAVPLKFNPALMGINQDLKAIFHHRVQWKTIENGYATSSFSLLYPLYMNGAKEKLDIGVHFTGDKAGAFKTSDFSLAVGYNIRTTNESSLSFAISAGYLQKSLNATMLTFDEQYVDGKFDAANPHSETGLLEKRSYPDFGFGALWYYNTQRGESRLNPYVGFAAYHLNRPNESFTGYTAKLPIRTTYIGGIKILGENNIDFNPQARMQSQEGNQEIALGLTVDIGINDDMKVFVGSYYRIHDAISAHAGFEHKYLTLGYCYDVVTDLSDFSDKVNANEFYLILKLNQSEKKSVKKYTPLF